MNSKPRSRWVSGLLLGAWLLVVAWQVEEHVRIREAAKADLRNRSKAVASTLGAVVRGLQFRGAVFRDRLEPVLNEMTNETITAGEVVSVALLNAAGEAVAAAGRPIDLQQKDLLQEGEHWGVRTMTRVFSVEGVTNAQAPVILEARTNMMRGGPGNFRRREPPPDGPSPTNQLETAFTNGAPTNLAGEPPPESNASPGFTPPPNNRPGPPRDGEPRFRRPFWARDLNDQQLQQMNATHELHGLVITLSTESLQAVNRSDLWLRFVILFFAGISAVGAGLALRNVSQTADLQIRLVRASELNSHLKELNLAAAGLAHETRNPLNIIRGKAQMISRLPDAPPDVREKSKTIVDETDKVTAQLTEFINYSRPREVRRTQVALAAACNEIVRTLAIDIEEKKLRVEVTGETLAIEADEQLLRQVLFNLLINAVQAAEANGKIQIVVQRASVTEAVLEVRDDGPGVLPENQREIFKPYFTTHQKGTGLGLAVVQQIVLAHGWEIACLSNEPRGAVFRITHLKLAA